MLGFWKHIHDRLSGKGKTINEQNSALRLGQLKEAIKLKCRRKQGSGVLLHQDNMPIHTTHVAVTEAANFGFELLPTSPYLPDLAPCDFFLFPQLKFHLHGPHFGNNDEVIWAVK